MNLEPQYVDDLWERALKSHETAIANLEIDSDTAVNRAYYASFYAISALFAFEGHFFKKHSGVRSALHTLLIHTRRISETIGSDYDKLLELRGIADYGVSHHVSQEKARMSIEAARRILHAVHHTHPDVFKMDN